MQEYDVVTCRRVNYIQAAMVQAAISIQRTQGIRAAISVLREEGLSEEVIYRVLSMNGQHRVEPYKMLTRLAVLLPR